jgi:hypothetical protein
MFLSGKIMKTNKIKSYYKFAYILALVVISGCTINQVIAPVNKYKNSPIPNITVNSLQKEMDAEVIFDSHGLTNVTTKYVGWSNILVALVGSELNAHNFKLDDQKTLNLEIEQINCEGNYVALCTVKVAINIAGSENITVISDVISHGLIGVGIENAINNVAKKIATNSTVLAYINA